MLNIYLFWSLQVNQSLPLVNMYLVWIPIMYTCMYNVHYISFYLKLILVPLVGGVCCWLLLSAGSLHRVLVPLNIATPHPLSRHLIITLTDGEHTSILIKSVIKTRLVKVYLHYKSSHMNQQKLIFIKSFRLENAPSWIVGFPLAQTLVGMKWVYSFNIQAGRTKKGL